MSDTNEKSSIIIAAYNEEDNIVRTVEAVCRIMPQAEIIVVDDGSTDQTLAVSRRIKNPLVKVIDSGRNFGKGHAIRLGIDHASGNIMAQIDADLQFPAEGLPALIQPIREGRADIVFGSRYLPTSTDIEKGSVSMIKHLASYGMGHLITFICRQRYTDVFAGFKSWKSDVIRALDIREHGFTYEAEIAIKAKKRGYKVIEIPTAYRTRTLGESKIKIVYHTFTIFWSILKLALAK